MLFISVSLQSAWKKIIYIYLLKPVVHSTAELVVVCLLPGASGVHHLIYHILFAFSSSNGLLLDRWCELGGFEHRMNISVSPVQL